jgi:hypothetical protein
MKPEWVVKLCLCVLLCGVSLLILNGFVDDSLLVCVRHSDRRVGCMISQINFLGQQHDSQEIVHLKMASLEFPRRLKGRLSSVSRVLLLSDHGEKIPLSAGFISSSGQPEPTKIVAQVNQFLQSQETRLEVLVIYTPRFFLLLPIMPLCLLLIIIKSKIKFKK